MHPVKPSPQAGVLLALAPAQGPPRAPSPPGHRARVGLGSGERATGQAMNHQALRAWALTCVTRDASGAASPGCSPEARGPRGPEGGGGTVTVTPRPLQLLIPSPSPIPEEDWAAAANTTANDRQACRRTTQARCSNGRVHVEFPVLLRAEAGLRRERAAFPRS